MTDRLATERPPFRGPAATVTDQRAAPIDLSAEQFRRIGHALVDATASMLASLRERPAAPGLTPSVVKAALGDDALPEAGSDPVELMRRATDIFSRYSTFNGHPRFFGYITAGPAPLGVLAELLTAAVNANCGAWSLSPLASEVERRTVRWIAELLGFPSAAGGLFVSGGNMANMVAVWAARVARAGWDVHQLGVTSPTGTGGLTLYASTETHTWIQKAAELSGLGARAIRWIPVDEDHRMRVDALRTAVREDRVAGLAPLLVVGTAGTVSTGAIDPLNDIAEICREEDLWFHVDGAYGAPAAILADAGPDMRAIALADSLAMDPHKWLYAPLEAGCVLVRDADALHDAFHHRPPYYHFEGDPADAPVNFHEWGPQNSRKDRALKVWLAIQHVGREGYERMIREDIALARYLHDEVHAYGDLERATCRLSITTFRFVPVDLRGAGPWVLPDGQTADASARDAYVDRLNTGILSALQEEGLAYLSNAVLNGRFHLRACVVNFRTTAEDVRVVPRLVVRLGRALDRRARGARVRELARSDAAMSPHPVEQLGDRWWSDRLARLETAQRSTLELAMAASSSRAFAPAVPPRVDLSESLSALAAGDRRAARRIRAFRASPSAEREPEAATAPPDSVPASLQALRDAQADLAHAIGEVTLEDRLLERRIVQEIEARALDYEGQVARLR